MMNLIRSSHSQLRLLCILCVLVVAHGKYSFEKTEEQAEREVDDDVEERAEAHEEAPFEEVRVVEDVGALEGATDGSDTAYNNMHSPYVAVEVHNNDRQLAQLVAAAYGFQIVREVLLLIRSYLKVDGKESRLLEG